MPERSMEGRAGAWHHHTLRTPGLAKCVKMYLVRYRAKPNMEKARSPEKKHRKRLPSTGLGRGAAPGQDPPLFFWGR